jgi:molybdate transport system substrate-binding protein
MVRLFASVLLFAIAGAAGAAEIKVLSAGAVEFGLVKAAEQFQRESGHQVKFTFGTAPQLRQRLVAGEAADILVAPPAVVDDFVKSGKVVAEGRAVVGKVGVGVAVRDGAAAPDISSPEAFKQALLAADSLVYNQASTGIYFEKLLERLGIAEQVRSKTTRYANGASVLEHVIKGKGNEIGIGAVTEITDYTKRGLKLVGPLPAAVQNYTSYAAGVMVGAGAAEPARAFIQFLTTPPARAAFASTGVD